MSLRAEAVTFGYSGSTILLDQFSLDLADGAMTAITGPSGGGKSTLLYLLGLLLQPHSGEVYVGGQRTSSWTDFERSRCRSRSIGFLFQDAALDSTRSVMDNVVEASVYGTRLEFDVRQRAHMLLEQLGIDVPPARRPTQVSGGQAQRIALCRALLAEPAHILADEPTGNLDNANARAVIDVLLDEAERGRCVAVVTHDPRVINRCHKVHQLS